MDGEYGPEYVLEEILADAHAGITVRMVNDESQIVSQKNISEIADKALKAKPKNKSGSKAVRYAVETLPDGKRYVKADRQVIFGNDIDSWRTQVENYINGKIRKGENVHPLDSNGEVITLTSTSAGKLSSYHDNGGRTLSKSEYETKANAAVHIDELVSDSRAENNKAKNDKNGKHGDFADNGWKYRSAFFLDFDRKYYKLTISAAIGSDRQVVYNIGKIEERAFPVISGSSAKKRRRWERLSRREQ